MNQILCLSFNEKHKDCARLDELQMLRDGYEVEIQELKSGAKDEYILRLRERNAQLEK